MKIQYCPICMQELEAKSNITYWCKLCKVSFHIMIEYHLDSPLLEIKNEN